MSPPRRSKVPHVALFAAALVPGGIFLAAIPWLKEQPDSLVFLLAGVTAVIAVAAGLAHSILNDRASDEWHRSGARFATQWGWLTGLSLMAVLVALPPFHDLIFSTVSWAAINLAHEPVPDREVVILTFTLGFIAVVIMQTIATVVMSIWWFSRMSRSSNEE